MRVAYYLAGTDANFNKEVCMVTQSNQKNPQQQNPQKQNSQVNTNKSQPGPQVNQRPQQGAKQGELKKEFQKNQQTSPDWKSDRA